MKYRIFSYTIMVVIFWGLWISNCYTQSLLNITYSYDQLERLTQVTTSQGDTIIYNYDEVGNILDMETRLSGVVINAKAYLQGGFNAGTSSMDDNLRTILPTQEPYTDLGYTHVNGGNETVNATVFSITNNNAIVDWVVIELRDANTPSTVLATHSALIQKDGDIVGMDGKNPVNIRNVSAGNYHVAIRHRNHLGIMTQNTLALSGRADSEAVDFTNSATNTWGTDAQKNVSDKMVLWQGNASGDDKVRYNGASNDKNSILFKVGLFTPNNIVAGYHREDVNMDGNVKYNGASNDKNAILFNVGLFTPNNIITEQLP